MDDASLQVITFTNNKGGVGKTVSCVNLAAALGRDGKKVLVIDLDSQCNTTSLLLKRGDFPTNNLMTFLNYELNSLTQKAPAIDVLDFIRPTEAAGVVILPNVPQSAYLERELFQKSPTAFHFFDKHLPRLASRFDYIVLDTPPNVGFFVELALCMSTMAIIPVEASGGFGIDGISRAVQFIRQVQLDENPKLKMVKILLTKKDGRANISKTNAEILRSEYGTHMLETEIPYNSAIQKAEMEHVTVFDYDRTSKGARAYRALTTEVMNLNSGKT